MMGATLSRWSMSYFAVGFVCLLSGEALMMAGFGFPATALAAPDTLVLVHLVAIGWLSLLMLGALFQFVPVLIAKPLYSDTLPLPTLALLVTGLAALLTGFLQLGSSIPGSSPSFPAAAVLLGCGVTLALWNLGRTFGRRARCRFRHGSSPLACCAPGRLRRSESSLHWCWAEWRATRSLSTSPRTEFPYTQ